MNRLGNILITVLAIIVSFTHGKAQQNIITSGTEIAGTGGKITQTIGQVFYSTVAGGGFSIVQGLQQTLLVSVQTGINTNWVDLITTLYPNPSNGLVILSVQKDPAGLNYCIAGADGKIISQSAIKTANTTIDLSTYANGIYFIKISDLNKELKSFKLIKN